MKYPVVFTSRNFYLLGLFTIVVGLSLSKPLISSGQIILLLTWLFGDNIKTRLIRFYQNRTAVFISSIYLLTLFGLIYTSNFDYAWGDVRRKAALLGLPILIAGFTPITNKEWKLIFKVYVAGVLASSLWSLFVFLGGLGETIVDVREYSRFNSHIRFGLEICFAIFGSIYFLRQEKNNPLKLVWLAVIAWLIAFLYLTSLFTGLVVFGITTLVLLFFMSFTFSKKWVKHTINTGFVLLFSFVFITISQTISDYKEQQNRSPLTILEKTISGESYFHEEKSIRKNEKENGYYVWKNIAWKEIEQAWNKRSKMPFDGLDLKGQDIASTLIRYISSKGLYKNAKGVQQLSSNDIASIEKGVPNYKFSSMNNLQKRLARIIWEFNNYENGRDFNGHSVIMRWEYWKTAYHIFIQNIWLGVGTGDVQDAFDTQYELDNSILQPRYRLRAHNQYITYAVTFGVLGIICFGFFLLYPFFKNRMYTDFIYLSFFSIVVVSMFAEDTLETQVGVNFVILFNTILLLKEKRKPQID
jgi:hypothetical protein